MNEEEDQAVITFVHDRQQIVHFERASRSQSISHGFRSGGTYVGSVGKWNENRSQNDWSSLKNFPSRRYALTIGRLERGQTAKWEPVNWIDVRRKWAHSLNRIKPFQDPRSLRVSYETLA